MNEWMMENVYVKQWLCGDNVNKAEQLFHDIPPSIDKSGRTIRLYFFR